MSTRAKGRERRLYPRVAVPCHLRYLRIPKRASEYRNATVQDIGQGGFRFRTSELFHRRSCFLFDVYLPGSNPVRSLATVVWIRLMPGDEWYQVGGKFVEPNPEVASALIRLVPEQ
jgi:PilZ domain